MYAKDALKILKEKLPPIKWMHFDPTAEIDDDDYFFRIPIFPYDPNNYLDFWTIGSAQVLDSKQTIEVREFWLNEKYRGFSCLLDGVFKAIIREDEKT